MMTSKVVRVLLGGTLLFLFNLPQVGDVASAADQKTSAQGSQGTKGTKGTQGVQGTEGTQGVKGTPCEIPHGQNAMQAEQDSKRGSHMIHGEVTRVDGTTYVVKDESGKEVKLQTDERTETSPINTGDRISANVDDKNHALWIRANRGTDRRTEHVSGDCDPN